MADSYYNDLISIITVCFNSEETLTETIKSVLNQSYSNIEYILIDGASEDSTIEIIKAFESEAYSKGIIYKWISEPDEGIYDAMNKGIKMCKGRYIGIINSDDWYQLDAIQNVVQTIADDECIITGQRAKYTYDKQFRKVIGNDSDIQSNVYKYMSVNHPSTFVPKSVYNKVGLYDTKYCLSADYDFIFRCVNSGIQFLKIDKVLANMRDEGATSRIYNLFITAKENYLIRKDYNDNLASIRYIKRIFFVILIIIRKVIYENFS